MTPDNQKKVVVCRMLCKTEVKFGARDIPAKEFQKKTSGKTSGSL